MVRPYHFGRTISWGSLLCGDDVSGQHTGFQTQHSRIVAESPCQMYEYDATLIKVVDGDTLDLNVDLGFSTHRHTRVRLEGINTPETYGVKKDSEEYKAGLKAKERVEELLTGQPLRVETNKTGKYGRYIAKVYFPGVAHEMLAEGTSSWDCLNDVLVAEGLAELKTY